MRCNADSTYSSCSLQVPLNYCTFLSSTYRFVFSSPGFFFFYALFMLHCSFLCAGVGDDACNKCLHVVFTQYNYNNKPHVWQLLMSTPLTIHTPRLYLQVCECLLLLFEAFTCAGAKAQYFYSQSWSVCLFYYPCDSTSSSYEVFRYS